MPSINDGCQIQINNIPFAEGSLVGNSVANDFIDTGANRIRIALVAKAGRRVPVFNSIFVGDSVKFERRDPGSDLGAKEVHELSIEETRT